MNILKTDINKLYVQCNCGVVIEYQKSDVKCTVSCNSSGKPVEVLTQWIDCVKCKKAVIVPWFCGLGM